MITLEDKRRITARQFFTDNRDQYEDFHEALAEFMNTENVDDKFVDFCSQTILAPQDGHVVMMREDGHVGTVRLADLKFDPRSEMSMDEGHEFEKLYEKVSEEYPDLEGVELMIKMGWKVVCQPLS